MVKGSTTKIDILDLCNWDKAKYVLYKPRTYLHKGVIITVKYKDGEKLRGKK